MSDDRVMFTLDASEQVTHWYHIVADLPTAPPPLRPRPYDDGFTKTVFT